MTKEFVITDNDDEVIKRAEVLKKVRKIEGYIFKAEKRFEQLMNQRTKIQEKGLDKEELKQGLKYYSLTEKISKEI